MSLVGPRPELPQIVADYQPWQHQRHQVKPGLTGFWQISKRAGGLAYEGVELDIEYLDKLVPDRLRGTAPHDPRHPQAHRFLTADGDRTPSGL